MVCCDIEVDVNDQNIFLVNKKIVKDVFQRSIFIDQTEKLLVGIDSWTWSKLLLALNNLNHGHNFVQKLVDEIVERLALPCIHTPFSSSKSSSFRSSCDSKGTRNTKTFSSSSRFWWFEDLSTLDIHLIEMLVNTMVSKNFDHCCISRFLFYYQRVRVVGATTFERGKIIQALINLLVLLNKGSISIKGLFETLRLASNLKLRRFYKIQLEHLIGLTLDQAEIDDMLLPLPIGKSYTRYNVNIVLRFLKIFLIDQGNCSYRLKRVARLVDQYAYEIAPDDNLKPSKFFALITAIPDLARDSYDKLYQAIEIYLEVHREISEDQKTKVSSVLNYNKLTPRVLDQLSSNHSFPLISIVKALLHLNPKLVSSFDGGQYRQFFKKSSYKVNVVDNKELMYMDEVVLIKELARNEKLRDHLQELGWTLIELETTSKELLDAQKRANLREDNVCFVHSNVKHLPKFCS